MVEEACREQQEPTYTAEPDLHIVRVNPDAVAAWRFYDHDEDPT